MYNFTDSSSLLEMNQASKEKGCVSNIWGKGLTEVGGVLPSQARLRLPILALASNSFQLWDLGETFEALSFSDSFFGQNKMGRGVRRPAVLQQRPRAQSHHSKNGNDHDETLENRTI